MLTDDVTHRDVNRLRFIQIPSSKRLSKDTDKSKEKKRTKVNNSTQNRHGQR